MSLKLFSQPLKPFPALLRAGPVTLEFDVLTQIAPSHSHSSPNQIIDGFERYNASEHRVAKSF
jgi:hypothetical protein